MEREKRTSLLILILYLTITMAVILFSIYSQKETALSSPEIMQNATYAVILAATFIFMRISRKSLREIGLFHHDFRRQIVTGIIIAIIFLIIWGILFGLGNSPKGNLLYLVLSQFLVALTEELMFRGYILSILEDIVQTPNRAVFISALLFGLWHYPATHNIPLVLITFLTGAIYSTLRIVFRETDDEISVFSITIAHWAFNVIST